MLHGQFAPEYLVRPPGTPWSNISGTHCHIAAERLVNFSGIPSYQTVYRLKDEYSKIVGKQHLISTFIDNEINQIDKQVDEYNSLNEVRAVMVAEKIPDTILLNTSYYGPKSPDPLIKKKLVSKILESVKFNSEFHSEQREYLKENEIQYYQNIIDLYHFYFYLILVSGLILFILGTLGWYFKIQRPQDELLKMQIAQIKQTIGEKETGKIMVIGRKHYDSLSIKKKKNLT